MSPSFPRPGRRPLSPSRLKIQGLRSPKTAKPLIDLSHTMLKAIPMARQEFISVYGEDELIATLADSFDRQTDPEPTPDNPEPSSNGVDAPGGFPQSGSPNSLKMSTSASVHSKGL